MDTYFFWWNSKYIGYLNRERYISEQTEVSGIEGLSQFKGSDPVTFCSPSSSGSPGSRGWASSSPSSSSSKIHDKGHGWYEWYSSLSYHYHSKSKAHTSCTYTYVIIIDIMRMNFGCYCGISRSLKCWPLDGASGSWQCHNHMNITPNMPLSFYVLVRKIV